MLLLFFVLSSGAAGCGADDRPAPLRFGTTHTVEQSGALAMLDSLAPPARLTVVVGPSGQVLHSGAAGDLDVVLTHAPGLEQRLLVAPAQASLRCPMVASRFALVGPPDDPAATAGASSAADAFARIARARAPFISRGDSSGTHQKEVSLWDARANARDRASWYVEAGVDQAATLRLAEQRGAYVLADLPTLARALPSGSDLRILFTADTALTNPYTLYVVRAAPAHPAAATFARWSLDAWRDRLLALRLPDGTPAFTPLLGGCTAP